MLDAPRGDKQIADFRPLYSQVKDLMIDRIGSGQWKPGEMIPSEFQLAAEFGVSQGTVRKAVIELERQRLVVRRQGRGTYVSQHSAQQSLFNFFRIVDLDGAKKLPSSVVIDLKTKRASKEEAGALKLPPRSSVHVLTRVRNLADRPVIRERIVLPAALFGNLHLEPGQEVQDELYVLYQSIHGVTIVRADEQLAAVLADEQDAELLGLPAGAPVLEIVRVALDIHGNPVELRTSHVNTSDYRYFSRIE